MYIEYSKEYRGLPCVLMFIISSRTDEPEMYKSQQSGFKQKHESEVHLVGTLQSNQTIFRVNVLVLQLVRVCGRPGILPGGITTAVGPCK